MTEEVEETISGLTKTVFDWDNLDLVAEAVELMKDIFEPESFFQSTWIGDLKYNENGASVHPPVMPEAPDVSKWKRITPKRQLILSQYRQDMREYVKAKDEWDALPVSNTTKMETVIDGYRQRGRIIREDGGIILLDTATKDSEAIFEYPCGRWIKGQGNMRRERPFHAVEHHEMEILEVREEIQTGFTGNASQPRRKYKRNRDLDMNTEYDTDIETGEQRQKTLFNCNTTSRPRRIVDDEVIDRFEEKPNAYLGRAYLDYILNGMPLTSWQKFQINKRIRKNGGYRGAHQSTLDTIMEE